MKGIKKMINRLCLYLRSDMKLILIEAYFFLALGRIYKFFPFHRVAPNLGKHNEETSLSESLVDKKQLARVSNAVHLMSKYTLWESQCLVLAIAAMKMLERRKIESTLYLGTGKDEKGKFIAHAWLRSGPYYISGFEGMEKFTVVSTFAKLPVKHQGKQEGENYG